MDGAPDGAAPVTRRRRTVTGGFRLRQVRLPPGS